MPTVPTVKKPFRIRPYADPARPTLHFIVTFRQAGKRRRKFFSTKKEADAFGQLLKVEFENRGAEGVAFPTALRTMAALNDWLAVRGAQSGAVFNPINKAGIIGDAGLTTTAMHKILAKRATEAKIENVTLHDFRRTVTGDLLDKGADIASVASLLGHSSVNTTARYDRRGQRARIAASALVSVPYVAA